MSDSKIQNSLEAIAVIGMAGRFPGAGNIDQFWHNLTGGLETVRHFSEQELLSSGISPAQLSNPNYVKARGILDDIDMFDASFFGLNPREAEITDPQHRVFLECAWEALENAGCDPDRYEGSIGIYAGVSMSTYLINLVSNPRLIESVGSFQIGIGNDKDFMPTRVSYKLNLGGPSVNVQCACSTSLVAVCLACQSLLNYQCDISLAGGVTIITPQESGYIYQEGGIGSPDGHCRAFDRKAQGTVSSNGAGVVVLKRLADAIADGDSIYAIVKGSAVNNDGSNKIGYTAPSVSGQVRVIAEAQALADIEPESVGYIEAHGTATALGDPIEIAALSEVFRASTDRKRFCAIGSVKTNIGHVDSAAGIAGFIKAVLALKHKMIPPSLHFTEPNLQIDLDDSPFYVNTKLAEWKPGATPRRAGVNSFGVGGTNAHVVLEEPPALDLGGKSRPWQLLVQSAKTESALAAAASELAAHLKQHQDIDLADVAFTLQQGRKAFRYRSAVVCSSVEDGIEALEGRSAHRVIKLALEPAPRPVAFMFPGQGTQYVNMGAELYEAEPVFRAQIDRCALLSKPTLGLDLRDLIYPSKARSKEVAAMLDQTRITQPALFAVEYALARLWMEWGIRPKSMIGHSIGEYVAACLSGVMTLEDALKVVTARGQMMQELPEGSMLSVPLSEDEVQSLLSRDVSLASVNSPSLCVLSGASDAIESIKQRLAEKRITSRRLQTSHAFHSVMMDAIVERFTETFAGIELSPPEIPYISNVTGTWVTPSEATDPGYWGRHLRQTVRFGKGVGELIRQSDHVLLEVGPGHTLSTLARQQARQAGQPVVSSLRHPDKVESDLASMLNAVGQLWVTGIEIDWPKFYAGERRHRIALPSYPFERQRYWVERQAQPMFGDARPPVRKARVDEWFHFPSWKRSLLPQTAEPVDAGEGACWLVFADQRGVAARLAERLARDGREIILVGMGRGFTKTGQREYVIDPRNADDYSALLDDLNSSSKTVQAVVHLWSVTGHEGPADGAELFSESQYRGYYSLLFLAQAIGRRVLFTPLRICVVSDGMQEVNGEEILRPEAATISGACKVIQQEYPNISCRSIDLSLEGDGAEQNAAGQLAAELEAATSDVVIAYRGAHRWVESFEPVTLSGGHSGRLREKGVYLITGGLGRIGLTFASYLARTARARLVLIGRSPFPARDQWDDFLAAGDGSDGVSARIRRLKELEEMGGEVLVISADVSDADQMSDCLKRIEASFGRINGVIHAAGDVGEHMMTATSDTGIAESERQFRPKVYGLYVLERLLRDREIDFWFLTSSLSSILGGLGFFAYSSANAFMDAFARRMNRAGRGHWISANWDAWQISSDGQSGGLGSSLADFGITPEEGEQAFEMLLGSNLTQALISAEDLEARINRWVRLASIRSADAETAGSQALHQRPDMQSAYIEPRDELEQAIADVWQALLGIDRIGIQDNFFELGGHSLLATQLMSRLRDTFRVELSLRNFFESPTIASLSLLISQGQETIGDSESLEQILKEIEELAGD